MYDTDDTNTYLCCEHIPMLCIHACVHSATVSSVTTALCEAILRTNLFESIKTSQSSRHR